MTNIAETVESDDTETCRRGRVWLGLYAGALAGFTAAATIAGYAMTSAHDQASDFAYARNDSALQIAATFAGSLPRGY